MRSYNDRYHNVFFAYRGTAVADIELSGGKQLEDNLTRALTVTLERVSRETVASFVSEICGISVPEEPCAEASLTMQALESPSDIPGKLVGISRGGVLQAKRFAESPGGSRPDLVIEVPGQAFVVIESKVGEGVDGSQLWRHARVFGLALPSAKGGLATAPDDWVLRSWDEVASWAEGCDDPDPVAAFLLGELAEYLHLAGVTGRAVLRPTPAQVEVDKDTSELLELLATGVDLDAISDICRRLYGDPDSQYYVHGDGESGHTSVHEDSAAVKARYKAAREKAPPRLSVDGGNVITARRALSIAYGPKDRYIRSIANPQTRDAVDRLVGVGADRAVLLGLLAWAWPRSGPHATHMRTIIAAAWPKVPPLSLAAEELHEELGADVAVALQRAPGAT